MRGRRGAVLVLLLLVVLLVPCRARAAEQGEEVSALLEKSGAGDLYDALDSDTQDLLEKAGVSQGMVEGGDAGEGVLSVLSELLRDRWTEPVKGLSALLGIVILCRLGNLLSGEKSVVQLAGSLACAGVLGTPLLELIEATGRVIESACVFLGASVPVYAGLMAASGSAASGSSYGLLALAAGSVIPLLSSALLLPLLRAFFMLALTSALCRTKLDRLLQGIYGFAKWALVFAVTLFSGILSVQTVLNAQMDAAANKTAKLLASSAIPIVGGAFGDAVAAIQSSVQMVKSGVGAFGILAVVCLFGPTVLRVVLWMGVCLLGQVACDLLEEGGLGSLFGSCASVAKMILAVLVSVLTVAIVCAALLLFVKGTL